MVRRFSSVCGRIVVAVAGTTLLWVPTATAANPFTSFSGQWSGGGVIVATGGAQEAISCKAKYSDTSSAASVHVNVRCASDSYKVHILIDVEAQGGGFSGTWQETTRQVSGDVSGQIPSRGQLQASLSGVGFGIQLAASSNGHQQAITIQSQNTDVQTVRITLRKR